MRIGIDLDGTVFQTYERMAEVFYLETGKEMDLSTIGSAEAMIPSELKWLKKYFEKPEAYNVAPYPNAIETLRELQKRHELYFITARRKEIGKDTRRAMKSYGFNKNIFITPWKNKVKLYKLLKLDLILEDVLCFVEPFYGSKKTKIILFDRPWNQEDACYRFGFRRIREWKFLYPAIYQLWEVEDVNQMPEVRCIR